MKKNVRVLIVEDERIPAEFLKEILETNDYEVIAISATGADAITIAKEEKPDIILMDIILKDAITGSEAALKISSLIETKIIFLTAHSDEEMITYALDAGAVNYLIKPYREQQILAALKLASQYKPMMQKESTTLLLKCGYSYDTRSKKLYLADKEVNLGQKSLRLLAYLCDHINTRISNTQLSYHVYGEHKGSSTLRTLISRINKSLMCTLIENSSRTGYTIHTVHTTS